MRFWFLGLSAMVVMTGCDKVGMGSDGQGGPGMSETSLGNTSTGGPGGTGTVPASTTTSGNPTSSAGTGVDTEGCGTEDTAADPWGDEDGCGGGLPTHSPYDVGNGGNCWHQYDRWREACEEEPCLDYDCQTPTLCGTVTFDECDDGLPGGASDSGDDGVATTGGHELEVDDPAALECILEALRDHVPIRYTTIDCGSSPATITTYEVASNGLVIVTTGENYSQYHDREQEIRTFNDEYDYASCVGAGVDNYEKRSCVGKSDNGPCPVGPVACPGE